MMAGDISTESDGLLVVIRSTKTRAKLKPIAFKIPPRLNPITCPVLAWKTYKGRINPWAYGPAFIHSNRLPVTGRQVVAIMRLALRLETDIDHNAVSLHSLRRGATQTSVDLGVPIQTIKTRGTWSSDAGMKPYLPSHYVKVPTVPVINLPD